MMYDELVKWLRDCGNDSVGCGGCPYNGRFMDGSCISGLLAEAADAIEELLQKTQQLPRWIPVTERLPSNSTKVLVFEFGRVEQAYTTTYTADGSLCWVVINGGSYHRISDADCPIKWWMPIPEPPKEENKCKSGNM